MWWQWAKEPHVQSATWLDARGQRVSEIELTRMPCDDPMVDLRPAPDGRMRVTWEQQIDNQQHVIVGLLSKDRVVRQGSEYVGRDPALLRDGVVMTSLSSSSVLYAPFGASDAAPLANGRMADGAVLGNDSVLCRTEALGGESQTTEDELLCSRELSGKLLHERSLARSTHSLGSAQIADTSFGYVVALEGVHPADQDTPAVHVTVVQCND